MQTKLTLRLDHDLIEQAKIFAQQQNKLLLQLVEGYILLLTETTEKTPAEVEGLLPITQSLSGILANCAVAENDYHRYLEKYL